MLNLLVVLQIRDILHMHIRKHACTSEPLHTRSTHAHIYTDMDVLLHARHTQARARGCAPTRTPHAYMPTYTRAHVHLHARYTHSLIHACAHARLCSHVHCTRINAHLCRCVCTYVPITSDIGGHFTHECLLKMLQIHSDT